MPQQLRREYRTVYVQWKEPAKAACRCQYGRIRKGTAYGFADVSGRRTGSGTDSAGEQQELQNRRLRIRNSGKITEALQQADALLSGGEEAPGACAAVLDAVKLLSGVVDVMPELSTLAGRLESLGYDLQDCMEEVSSQCGENDFDPQELDDIEERLNLYYHLSLKYGETEEEMLQYLEKCRKEP